MYNKEKNTIVKKTQFIRNAVIVPSDCTESFIDSDFWKSLKKHGFDNCGFGKWGKDYYNGCLVPENWLLLMSQSGEGLVRCGDMEYTLCGNQAILLPPNKARDFFSSKKQAWVVAWAFVNPRNISWSLKTLSETVFSSLMIPSILNFFQIMYQRQLLGQKELQESFVDIAHLLLNEIVQANSKTEEEQACETLWNNVAQNLAYPWSNEKLSKELMMSLTSFQRLMQSLYNQTARQKLIELRMNKAKFLLTQTNYSLQTIAERLGYSTAFIFSNAFKKHFKHSPQAWKRKCLH